MKVVVFGSMNLDTILDVDRLPAWGETILARAAHTAPGGKGGNQAVAARRLGAAVVMVGRVGRDAAGDLLCDALATDGVQNGLTTSDTVPTGAALVLRATDGRNVIIVSPGANATARAADLGGISAKEPTILLLQLEIPIAEVKAAAMLGRERGWYVILNASPAGSLDDDLMAAVRVLVANEHEAGQLSGIAVDGIETARAASQFLRRRGCPIVVVTLGALGATLVSERGAWYARAPAVEAIDSTGAGDAFIGALAVGLADGLDQAEALRRAVASGTLSVTRLGAQPSLPTRAKALELASRVAVVELQTVR